MAGVPEPTGGPATALIEVHHVSLKQETRRRMPPLAPALMADDERSADVEGFDLRLAGRLGELQRQHALGINSLPESQVRALEHDAQRTPATTAAGDAPTNEAEQSHMTQTTVRYFVTDVDEAIDFYCNRLGFHVDLPSAPGFAGLAKDDLRLLLHEPGVGGAGKAGGIPKPGGWNRFQIVVADLDMTVERLAAQGTTFRGETVEGPGGRQIVIEDPAGNPVELFQPKSA